MVVVKFSHGGKELLIPMLNSTPNYNINKRTTWGKGRTILFVLHQRELLENWSNQLFLACWIISMSIYSWSVSILKDIEKWIRNFIWCGDTTKRKLVTVAWKKMCKPYLESSLGLRYIVSLNEAFNLKLCWDMMQSNEDWANILKCRAVRGNRTITHHIFSSIWSSIKVDFRPQGDWEFLLVAW